MTIRGRTKRKQYNHLIIDYKFLQARGFKPLKKALWGIKKIVLRKFSRTGCA